MQYDRRLLSRYALKGLSGFGGATYPSGEGRLYAEDVIVNIEGAAGTMIVSV